MLKLFHDGPHHTGTPPDVLKRVYYVSKTVSRQAVGIRLKYLLVIFSLV